MKPIQLSALPVEETAYIIALHNQGSMRQRLLNLGFAEGTAVKAIQKSPFGDPTAYLVRGTVIALREKDAARILVAQQEGGAV